ncbi:hypothetical protein ACEN41_06180 [Campylobacter bilis]|uniref:hypothetical protein n=1 Tax=Campylobacter bilis TaxID=2691918 RepID=UPI0035946BF0
MQKMISNALEAWDFNIVENLYKQNLTNKYKEYIDLLYQVGNVNELILLFDNLSSQHIVEIREETYLGDFFEFYNFLKAILTFNDQEIISCIKAHKHMLLCINYIISRSILNFHLKKDLVISLFPYVIKSNSLIFQSFFIKQVVDYFSCIDKKFFCNDTRNILTVLQENFHTNMTEGARIYYEKFLLNYNYNIFYNKHLKSSQKVALCISGAMRGIEWEVNLKKVIESFPFNVDVFLFTWNSEFLWPGLNGAGGSWAKRLLNKELLDIIPEQIMHRNNLKNYFPHVFFKLNQEYSIPINLEKLPKTDIIKKIIVKNQDQFLKKYGLNLDNIFINISKIWYANYELLKSIICYEAENNFQYDFIIKVRPDLEYNINFSIEDLDKMHLNDLMIKHHESLNGGLNDNFAAGRRCVMEIYLSLWKYGFLNKSINFFKDFPNFNSAHDMLLQFCSLMKINCIPLRSNTIKNFYFIDFIPPNFSKELTLDCKRIDCNSLEKSKLSKSIDFLKKYQEYSKLYNYDYDVYNHLSYKLGTILIDNSKKFIWLYPNAYKDFYLFISTLAPR